MKIAHVLTYISADGAFGGPLAVAAGHAAELAARGNEVEVFAGWDGVLDFQLPGVTVNLFKVRQMLPVGFSGLVAPALIREIWKRGDEFDVIHVHLARDLITTPTALAVLSRHRNVRVFVQCHGMIQPDRRVRARIFDLGVRRVLHKSRAVLALNDVDAAKIGRVSRIFTSILELPNGVQEQDPRRYVPETPLRVLFLARLHQRKRVMVFAQAAANLLQRGVQARFAVVGPDEGDLVELDSFIAQNDLSEHLTYEGVLSPGSAPARLAQADIYVLPSLNEPFPMSVLESLSVGTPTVISRSCHIAAELLEAEAVLAFDGGGDDLARTLLEVIGNKSRLQDLSSNGQKAIESVYSLRRVVDLLESYYHADQATLLQHKLQYSR